MSRNQPDVVTVFGAVFARAGSKGVPGKNLRRIGGKSLLQISVELGFAVSHIDRVLVSTDSPEIAELAGRLGAEVPYMRPDELATDDAQEWSAWQHLAQHLLERGATGSDLLVSLPPTAPLRAAVDVERAIQLFNSDTFDLVLGVAESARNPWFNMVTRDETFDIRILLEGSKGPVARRQDAPTIFDITTVVYVTSLSYVVESSGLFTGRVGSVVVPSERAIDIDTKFDLKVARLLAQSMEGADIAES